ncbi:hypothetical protein JOL79_07005 [Microbispora sp. RL4-1S]|uniref:Uncharacterized protein n=1 Tax=Microbispora oryzae TaxID=2806554 RepID=A0A940WGD4_9ACTN|nr:hypothetical protein [Microbispora oryzae]MBP2703547.1 hypothetical protein [Microbispora oryzae]
MTQEPSFELIGLGGIAALWGKTREAVYSMNRRGKFGEPDWYVGVTAEGDAVPVWLAERFGQATGEVDTATREGLPDLVGMEEIAVGLDVQRRTVEQMRARGRKDIPTPQPYTLVGRTPVWWAESWQEFARLTGRPWSLTRLRKVRRDRLKAAERT